MSVFAIGDLHLSGQVDKPMDVFGGRWDNHTERLQENWNRVVGEDDTVLVVGDISWALKLEEAESDLRFVHNLPGQKILLRGNHDYWWQSFSKNQKFCREKGLSTLHFLQNDALEISEDAVVAGSRLWLMPDDTRYTQSDAKILHRECSRLNLSLEAAGKLRQDKSLIVIFHYPPFEKNLSSNKITKRLQELSATLSVYGHIHHEPSPYCLDNHVIDDVPYSLVAADYLKFEPKLIFE